MSSRLMISNAIKASTGFRILLNRNNSLESRANHSEYRNDSLKNFLSLDMNGLPKEDVENTLVPFDYHISMPNKRLGYGLINGFNYWMKLPSDVIETVGKIWVASYEAGALIDDIIDESDYRRGLPVSPKLFGIARTAICSQASFFLLLKKLMSLKNEKVVEMYVDNIIKYSVGLYKEADYKQKKICPTLSEFEQICINKCDGLAGFPIKLMQALSDCKTDFTLLSNLLSLHVQYLTDTSNLSEQKVWDAKTFCEDISEGKFTLAAIHAVNTGTLEGKIVYNIVCSRTKDVPTLSYCLSLLKDLGSIEFARKTTILTENRVREEIKRLGGNPPLLEYLEELIDWAYDEKYPQAEKKNTQQIQ